MRWVLGLVICLLLTVTAAFAGLCTTPGRFTPIKTGRFAGKNCEQISQSLGLTLRPGQGLVRVVNSSIPIPVSFDWRLQQPQCKHGIRDQAMCGACWAFATTRPLAWRFCIFAPNLTSLILSPQYMLDCDDSCYQQGSPCEAGCQGGFLDLAWQFLHFNGTVQEECLPYSDATDPACPALLGCQRLTALDDYAIKAFAVADIQREIIEFGPVTAGMEVFSDFLTYSGGVYVQQSGDVVGAHAITLLGWGTSPEGVDYWIAENQWGTSWGELGYLRIRRGTNEVGIEQYVHAGRPNATGVEFAALEAVVINANPSTSVAAATGQWRFPPGVLLSVLCLLLQQQQQ